MDSIGDYLYLAIIGIAALSGILKKKKKASTSSPLPEDVLGEYGQEDYEDIPLETFEPVIETGTSGGLNQKIESIKNPKITHTEYLSYETTVDSTQLRSKKQVSRLEKSKAMQKEDEYEQEFKNIDGDRLVIELNTPRDAKLAFIYSEIFNRKY